MSRYCQLWLTCADSSEASNIAKTLLGKRLIACAKQIKATSQFQWKGKIEEEAEVVLLMDSRDDLCAEIEQEIAKLHSYDTFVLTASPIIKISGKAKKWLDETLIDK